jgi:hypothetical protein
MFSSALGSCKSHLEADLELNSLKEVALLGLVGVLEEF